ncbi:heterokaryon incompatibility protein-domain-containing protein, partial [Flammula alnicola]
IKPQIDPNMIKNWIQLCETLHGESCMPKPVIKTSENPSGLKILRVIDVEEFRIVDATPGTRYLALSYVWGEVVPSVRLENGNYPQLTSKGGIRDIRHQLPTTINDTIDFVASIGERYLWIDNLCLIQDDEDDMLLGIAKMDLVYQGAIMTVIAAYGTHANAGLPGLRSETRYAKQVVEEVAPGLKMAISKGVYDILTQAPYHSRGWTMQEFVLSHRTLIFAADCARFLCRKNCWSEETIYDQFPTVAIPIEALHSGNLTEFILDNDPHPLESYSSFLFHYSTRNLTKESDTIYATTGVLHHIAGQIDSGLLEGIPTVAFDACMLFWDPFQAVSQRIGRRLGFPSWSWAGWHGMKITFGNYVAANTDSGDFREWLRTMTYVVWYKRVPKSNKPELVWDLELQEKFGKKIYEREPDPELDGLPTAPSERVSRTVLGHDYTLLHFWAYTVCFSALEPPDGQDWSLIYKILGVHDIECGGIKIDDPKLLPTLEIPYEAVIVSKVSRYNDLFNDKVEVDKPIYWILLIEWVGPERVIAERRGIGYVFLDCLEYMLEPGKVWKEIVLA